MLSVILAEADANKIAFSGADDGAVSDVDIVRDLISADPDAALLEQPAGLAGALRKARLEEDRDQVGAAWPELAQLGWQLPLAETPLPLGFSRLGGVCAVQPLYQAAGDSRFGIPRIVGQLVALEQQSGVSGCQRVGDRHHLAVDLLRRLADADVVAQRLAHLVDPVQTLQEREHGHVLRRLGVGALDVPAEEQVEELVGATDLEVRLDRDRVVALAEGVEQLVGAYGLPILQALGEVLSL